MSRSWNALETGVAAASASQRLTARPAPSRIQRPVLGRRGERTRTRVATPAISESRARRVLNVVVAAIGLIVSAPLMLAIAALIRLTSPGPALYTQRRVGLDRRSARDAGGNGRRRSNCGGSLFTIYKFRTMTRDASSSNCQVWAKPDDARVTPVGRILRKYRLDELPQLWNVLKGDMNVVGPRPEQPAIFAQLRERVPRYEERQRVRPGITGWAQVNQCYDRSLEDVRRKLAFDLEYLSRASTLEDFRIMFRTLPAMLLKKNGW
jgi:lipopolysaccharide/colanic/teichoic acid biosynthesis glycosyltransferase